MKYSWFHSLKNRLIIILLMSSFLPILLIGIISYNSISSLQNDRVSRGIQNDLSKDIMTLEESFDSLNHVAQQLALEGELGDSLYSYMNMNGIEKRKASKQILQNISYITSTNPKASLVMYYDDKREDIMFQNYPVRDDFFLEQRPVLATTNGVTFFGPHRTQNRIFNDNVVSISRKVDLPQHNDLYIYVEANNKMISEVLKNEQYGDHIFYLVVNQEGKIIYSEREKLYPLGTHYSVDEDHLHDYYNFVGESDQGWEIIALIKSDIFEKETRSWLFKYSLFALLSLCVSLFFVFIIWRTVYRPLATIKNAILSLNPEQVAEPKLTHLIEFDFLLRQFYQMNIKIKDLLADIRSKEKKKAKLEVEKLNLQINPHFIHNTLDTFRWMARLNGQEKMDHYLSIFNRLIQYNVNPGKTTTVMEELIAINDYVRLQEVRYNIKYNVSTNIDRNILGVEIPRFILQPIVENAFIHGIEKEGNIDVDISLIQDEQMIIKVRNSGSEIKDIQSASILNEQKSERSSGGIGLQYVARSIEFYYGSGAKLKTKKTADNGMEVSLIIPITVKKGRDHK